MNRYTILVDVGGCERIATITTREKIRLGDEVDAELPGPHGTAILCRGICTKILSSGVVDE